MSRYVPLPGDGAIADWMRDALAGRPPEPLPPTPPPVIERWWPAPAEPAPLAGARIESCHPSMARFFPGLETIAIGRSPRGARRGRPSRLKSRKAGRVMRLTSGLEFDEALDCELDAAVGFMCEQPIWLRYVADGKVRRHRPDLYLDLGGRPEFREVKYEAQAALAENEARWPLIAAALNALGFGYRVRTEREIRETVRYEAVWQIFEDRHTPTPDPALLEDMLRMMPIEGMTLDGLRRIVPDLSRDAAHALVRLGVLAVDLDRPLDDATAFRRGRERPTQTMFSEG